MKRYCRNCYHPLPYKAKFCAHCGQKDSDGRIGMKSLLGRLWNNTFHLEGKFIRTAWQLFIPGKVTVEFFKGKQDRYPHPIRLFAIVMFLFLFLLNWMLKEQEATGGGFFADGERFEFVEDSDSTHTKQSFSFYEQMKNKVMLSDMKADYKKLPAEWKTPQARDAVDSVIRAFAYRNGAPENSIVDSLENMGADTISFGILKNMRFATLDVVRYDPNEIIHRYKITSWLDQMVVRQTIKSYKTPQAFVHAMLGSLTWAILALVALMSAVLALLYIRQHRYYVEHFIFLLHFHTGAMLLLLVAFGGKLLGAWGAGMVGFAAFLPLPAMYLALRRYYGQGWFKTSVKWLLYGFFYLFAFTFLFVAGMFVVFAFY